MPDEESVSAWKPDLQIIITKNHFPPSYCRSGVFYLDLGTPEIIWNIKRFYFYVHFFLEKGATTFIKLSKAL